MNLSKSGGGGDQGSTGDQSDRSEVHSPVQSIRDDDENLSDDNISDVDEREEKDEGKPSPLGNAASRETARKKNLIF